jgi:hypothetical protein
MSEAASFKKLTRPKTRTVLGRGACFGEGRGSMMGVMD